MGRALRGAGALVVSLVLAAACSPNAGSPAPRSTPNGDAESARAIPFDYVGQSWMRVPARIGDGAETRMMIDTGMGVTLVTPEACARAGCVREGSWSGQRMSGQTVELTIARVSSITVAGHRVENARVAVFESDDVIHRDLGVEGIAGLDVFRDQPVTFDHPAMRVVLESPASLAARKASGTSVPARVKHDGPSTEIYLPLEIAPGVRAEMEVDSGSLHMILDDRFMTTLGIDPDGPNIERKDGSDETGAAYVRRYAKLPKAVHVPSEQAIGAPEGTTVMFQKIIHDGLIGQQFLKAHVVTFDLPRGAMIFGR